MTRSATMHDVARLAGVSQRTVSNVVNDFVHVAPATREKVQQAISALGYRPHLAARRLRGGRTGVLALALPELRGPYFAELADLIQRTAHARGMTLLVDQTDGIRARELQALDGYRSSLVDGLIISPLAISGRDVSDRGIDVPIVVLGEQIDEGPFFHVSIDNVAASAAATEHLIGIGRTRIAFLGAPPGPFTVGPGARRVRGYREAMGAAGLPIPPARVIETGDWSRSSGYRLAESIPADADAVLCANDLLALGLLRRLHELGTRVPEDIAVMGWDDTEESRYSTPTLSTVVPDLTGIAEAAVAAASRPVGQPEPDESLHAGFRIAARESTLGTGMLVG